MPVVIKIGIFIVACALLAAAAVADDAPPQYNLKEDGPRTGSRLREVQTSGFQVPINRRYDQLSAEEKAKVHAQYEGLREGDEPPFPADGLKPLYDAIRNAQNKLMADGMLTLIADVNEQGKVKAVKVLRSPDPDLTKAAAGLLVLTRFKPALCQGVPCSGDYPVNIDFTLKPAR